MGVVTLKEVCPLFYRYFVHHVSLLLNVFLARSTSRDDIIITVWPLRKPASEPATPPGALVVSIKDRCSKE